MKSMKYDLLKYEDLKDRIIAFVDILGFNNRVKAIRDGATFINVAETLHEIKIIADTVASDKTFFEGFNVTAVSDSMIISSHDNTEEQLFRMLLLLHRLQYELLFGIEPTLLRGFVTRGPVYHKNGFIFGGGYSNSYECERLIGHAPRIVINPKIISEQSNDLFCLKEDSNDGFRFIDYLNILQANSPHSSAHRTHIQTFIDQKLKEFKNDIRIYPKYKWLANYFAESADYFVKPSKQGSPD